MRSVSFITLFVIAPLLASAQEPFHVKNDVLGEPVAAYRANNGTDMRKDINKSAHIVMVPVDCAARTDERGLQSDAAGVQSCVTIGRGEVTYATLPAITKGVSFYQDKLYSVDYSFSHNVYDRLKDSLISKYGTPTSANTEEFQNAMGAHFKGESLIWHNGVSSIALKEYNGGITSSALLFVLDAVMIEVQQKQKALGVAQRKSDM